MQDFSYGLGSHSTGVYTVGFTGGSPHALQVGGAGPYSAGDAFVRKYDTRGSLLWGKQFGTRGYEIAGNVTTAGDTLYVTGSFGDLATEDANGILIRFGTTGNGVWRNNVALGVSLLDI